MPSTRPDHKTDLHPKFRRATKLLVPAALAGLMLALTGCSGSDAESAATDATAGDTWGSADGPNIVLDESGTFSANDGCNVMNGTWEQDGEKLEFALEGRTMSECVDVDNWLSDLSAATVDADTLHVLAESGEEIGTLSRE